MQPALAHTSPILIINFNILEDVGLPAWVVDVKVCLTQITGIVRISDQQEAVDLEGIQCLRVCLHWEPNVAAVVPALAGNIGDFT